jgi:hypothetical protein
MVAYIGHAHITGERPMPFMLRFTHIVLYTVLVAQVVCGWSSLYAQENDRTFGSRFVFLPSGIAFPPLLASYGEPRVGVRKQVGTSRLKIDIGNQLDLAEFRVADHQSIRVGSDLFGYALTTNAYGLRLQVDAVDAFFGGHIVYRNDLRNHALVVRLRILHLSAHLVDGHYDHSAKAWSVRDPKPYTRDFGELTFLYEVRTGKTSLMFYSGISYAVLVRPEVMRRVMSTHGVELRIPDVGSFLGKPVNLYVADHLMVHGAPVYIGTNNLEFGLKLGTMSGSGIRLYGSYYTGMQIFGQYYDETTAHWAVGFALDFW